MKSFVLSLSMAMAAATPLGQQHKVFCRDDATPAFILAGDSTTAVQSTGGGGWGNGFLSFLKSPAWGINKGHNGATTVSFVAGGDWANVTGYVDSKTADGYDVYVTIQFGHNDQVCMPCFYDRAYQDKGRRLDKLTISPESRSQHLPGRVPG